MPLQIGGNSYLVGIGRLSTADTLQGKSHLFLNSVLRKLFVAACFSIREKYVILIDFILFLLAH